MSSLDFETVTGERPLALEAFALSALNGRKTLLHLAGVGNERLATTKLYGSQTNVAANSSPSGAKNELSNDFRK
jgi:hypothetical protein